MGKPVKMKAKMGRPKIEIDVEEFEKLCGIQCTLVEISAWFRCTEDTIETWAKATYGVTFSEIYKQKRGVGKISLRRRQYQVAVNDGNPTMLIWLGKQYLDQSDKNESKNETTLKVEEANNLSTAEIKSKLKELIQ